MALSKLQDQRETLNVLWYGDPGTGKTTHMLTLAKRGKVVLINAEGGAKKRALAAHGIPVENVAIHTDISFDALDKLFWELKAQLDDNPEAWVGVVWDSVTETQKILLEQQVAKGVAKAQRKGGTRGEFETFQEDWGVITEQMRRLTRRFRDLPVHLGLSCLSRRDEDEESGKIKVGPATTPAFQQDVTGYVDIVLRTHTEMVAGEPEFQGDALPKGKYIAKDRFHILPRVMVDPTFDRIIGYVSEDMKIESDPVMQAAKKRRATEDKAPTK